jgi:hypothetical protein
MTQLRYLGALTMAGACLAAGVPAASAQTARPVPAHTVRQGDLTFTSASSGGESVLAVETPWARVEQRVTSAGSGTIVLTAGADRVEITVTRERLRIARGGRVEVVTASAAAAGQLRSVSALLRGAPAIEAGARLRAAIGEDAPGPLVSALAFAGMLSGDASGMRRVAARTARPMSGIQFARYTAEECWRQYELSINIFFHDFEECIDDHRWNYILYQACNFTYVVQAEIAWFSLLSCAGGLPAV